MLHYSSHLPPNITVRLLEDYCSSLFMSPIVSNVTNHGDPHLLCKPSNWTSILSFFLANYAAHAATVLSYPGESSFSYAVNVLLALLLPATGFLRGCNAIVRFANLVTDDLTKAARASALCMVIRSEDKWCGECFVMACSVL